MTCGLVDPVPARSTQKTPVWRFQQVGWFPPHHQGIAVRKLRDGSRAQGVRRGAIDGADRWNGRWQGTHFRRKSEFTLVMMVGDPTRVEELTASVR